MGEYHGHEFDDGLASAASWQALLEQTADPDQVDQGDEAARLGAPAFAVDRARRIRRLKEADKERKRSVEDAWFESAARVHVVPTPDSGKAATTEGPTQPDRGSPNKVGTPKSVSLAAEASPPIVSFTEALAGRRRAIAEKQAAAKELQALIDVGGPVVVSVGSAAKQISPEVRPSMGPKEDVKPQEVPKAEFRIREGEPEWNSLPVEELLKAKKPKRSEEEWIADLLARPGRGLEYAKGLAEASVELGYSQKHIEDELKERRGKKPEKDDGTDPKQSSKLLAIGLGGNVRLWHSPEGVGYASVLVDEQRADDGKVVVGEHWENYQLNSKAFKGWLRTKYGDTHRVKIGEVVAPQAVSDGALKDAISSLEGFASRKPEAKPAVRVSRCNGAVWIDLGGPDWSAVRVTAKGWNAVQYPELPGVAFVRPKTMLALPSKPVKGGDIRRLAEVLNVKEEQFVLAVGWLLQCLNPVGPYPLVYPNGEAELGKTTTTKLLCRTVDPNSVQLRRKNRVEDLLIAAKNNWVVGFDNCSSITPEWSDTLSMLATGIGVGKRANYTDDEEHSFVVERPVAFNGIPGDLTERADLASRTIKLDVPALAGRRSMADLERAFDAIWPEVFGALLWGRWGLGRCRCH
jgi:hypothetical protein